MTIYGYINAGGTGIICTDRRVIEGHVEFTIEAESPENVYFDGTALAVRTPEEIWREDVIQESLAEIERLKEYLAETDWYVIRNLETDIEIPVYITQERAAARTRINELEELCL